MLAICAALIPAASSAGRITAIRSLRPGVTAPPIGQAGARTRIWRGQSAAATPVGASTAAAIEPQALAAPAFDRSSRSAAPALHLRLTSSGFRTAISCEMRQCEGRPNGHMQDIHSPEPAQHTMRYGARLTAGCRFLPLQGTASPASSHRGQIASGATIGARRGARGAERARFLLAAGRSIYYECFYIHRV